MDSPSPRDPEPASPHDHHDDEPASPSAKKSRKEKKSKKEKKHRHKEHKHKRERRDKQRSGSPEPEKVEGGDGSPAAAAVAAAAAAEPPAAAEGGGDAAPPHSPPANGAAEPPAAAAPAGAAGDDASDQEEGELPGALPPQPPAAADEKRDDRDRSSRRSRSRSPARGADRGERLDRDRDRDRGDRYIRTGRERSPRRERSERPEERRKEEERGRDRPPSRPRSRSPDRRADYDRGRRDDSLRPDRSRREDDRERDRARLPPRPYDRGVDRRRGPDDWRRGEDDRRRGGGGWEDRQRGPPDGRGGRRSRSRSRSRSRDRRKRDRSGSPGRGGRGERRQEEEEDDEEFQRRVAAALEGGGEEDEDRLIEERRRRRQEILARHREQQQLSESVAAPTATALRRDVSVNFQPEGAAAAAESVPPSAAPSAPVSAAPSPGRQPAAAGEPAGAAADGMPPPSPEPGLSDEEGNDAEVAAAGEGGVLDIWKHDEEEQVASPRTAAMSSDQAAAGTKTGIGEDDGELAKRVGIRRNVDVDMFAAAEEEEDDIFAATPPEARAAAAAAAAGGQAPAAPAAPTGAPTAAAIRKGLLDNYDDAEGYYNFQVGEVLLDKYEVVVSLGKGVFSSVLKARDLSRKDHDTNTHPEVAIKVIRANETMYKAGQMEKVILRKLSEADKEGRRHCIRMLSSFEYRNHLCLVFESLDLNLRELTKRYGRGIGLAINAVRIYAQQMLVGLLHLKNCGVLHADIKPDNILVNDRRTVIKLCDFGSAMFTGDNEITPYLVSRFYRPPEVILGLPYDHPMDMWSVGCVIYELFTGHILFPGKTNNEMLKLMMDVKGPFPKKMIKKAEFGFKHFESDPNMSFALLEEDPVTKRPVRRLIPNPTIKADFAALLAGQSPDRRKLAQLADLLERMMALDPDKRISPKDALRHPFIKEPPQPPGGGAGGAAKK